MKSKLHFVLPALLAGVLLTWYFSPYYTLYEVREAVKTRDADRFSKHVDYETLRKNLSDQLLGKVEQQAKSQGKDDSKGVFQSFGRALVDQMVKVFVRPEFVMAAMNKGGFNKEAIKTGSSEQNSSDEGKEKNYEFERNGPNMITVFSVKTDGAGRSPGIVFERTGFLEWKLTNVNLK